MCLPLCPQIPYWGLERQGSVLGGLAYVGFPSLSFPTLLFLYNALEFVRQFNYLCRSEQVVSFSTLFLWL